MFLYPCICSFSRLIRIRQSYSTLRYFSAISTSMQQTSTRASKKNPYPAPLYNKFRQGDDDEAIENSYCRVCGRIIGQAKERNTSSNKVRHCSQRCRKSRLGHIDNAIEEVFVRVLSERDHGGMESGGGKARKGGKGYGKSLVRCDEVQALVYGPESVNAKKSRGQQNEGDGDTVSDAEEDVSINPSSTTGTNVENNSVDSTHEDSHRAGMRRAEERERVRRAATRGCVFGFDVQDDGEKDGGEVKMKKRRCEAIVDGKVVEPSFAKGDWGVRWRER